MRLICNDCSTTYNIDEIRWQCDCNGILDIEFKAEFPRQEIAGRKPGMWRYREAIPIPASAGIISFDEGFTPLIPVSFGNHQVLIKQEQLFASGSFKDRGASVLISHARALGIDRVVEDSSGNAGSAMAAYCAKAGMDCDIYVPGHTSPGKLAQIQAYGATLNKIPGTRQDTAEAVMDAARSNFYASHYWSPFFFHGTKTFAFEVCEQLGWTAPDRVILPAGHGSLLLGAFIGFSELKAAGIISKLPAITAVQVEHCAPLFHTQQLGAYELADIEALPTVAEGIAITRPVRWKQLIHAIEESNGWILTVSEHEIKEALSSTHRKGYYIEPTSAAVVAGVKKWLQHPRLDEKIIVSAFTGHGLKSPPKS